MSGGRSRRRLFSNRGYTSLAESPAKMENFDPLFSSVPPYSVSGATTHIMTIPQWFLRKHTSKPFIRLRKDSFSPLSADGIFSITAPMRARCSSTIDALLSAVDRPPGSPAWAQVTGGTGKPPKAATYPISKL